MVFELHVEFLEKKKCLKKKTGVEVVPDSRIHKIHFYNFYDFFYKFLCIRKQVCLAPLSHRVFFSLNFFSPKINLKNKI